MDPSRAVLSFAAVMAWATTACYPSGSESIGAYEGQAVVTAYSLGVREINEAGTYEHDAAAATGNERARVLDWARVAYGHALDEFQKAVDAKPDLFQAWSYIGYTQRHLGDYDSALAAYARALELNPNYAEAIEYRAEAYLGLNKIEPAKSAYMELFRSSRPLADELMVAMGHWLSERRRDSAGTSAAELNGLAQWLDERATIARQTVSLATEGQSHAIGDWK